MEIYAAAAVLSLHQIDQVSRERDSQPPPPPHSKASFLLSFTKPFEGTGFVVCHSEMLASLSYPHAFS